MDLIDQTILVDGLEPMELGLENLFCVAKNPKHTQIAKLPRKTQNLALFTTLDRGATAYYVHHTNPNELESHNSLLLRRVSKKKLEFLNFFFAFKLGMSSSFLKSTSGHIRC